jgi:alpha-mannosidase
VFDNVFKALLRDPTRTFTHYETKFFSSWYKKQSATMKKKVELFIALGLFEFVNGGWDMHDETCPSYSEMLINLQKGHQFLLQEFNQQVRVGWSIETSGHSMTHPRLMAEAGIEALYVLNIDPEDR